MSRDYSKEIQEYMNKVIKLQADNERLLSVVQKAYRKHHMNDTSIGWDELADDLSDTLCELMGDNQYQKWHHVFPSHVNVISA